MPLYKTNRFEVLEWLEVKVYFEWQFHIMKILYYSRQPRAVNIKFSRRSLKLARLARSPPPTMFRFSVNFVNASERFFLDSSSFLVHSSWLTRSLYVSCKKETHFHVGDLKKRRYMKCINLKKTIYRESWDENKKTGRNRWDVILTYLLR